MCESNGERENGKRYFVSRYVCRFGNIKKVEVTEKPEKAVTIVLTCKPFKKKETKAFNVNLPKSAIYQHESGALEIKPWALNMAVDHGLYVNALDPKQEASEGQEE